MKFFRSFMARYLRFFSLGLVLLVALECGALTWLDKVYFRSDPNFKITHLSTSAFSKAANAHISVDSDGGDFQTSYDGSYVSYMSGNKLIVADMSSGTKITVPDVSDGSMQIVCYAWAYDRNRMILAEKGTGSSDSRTIKLFYFQPSDKDNLQEIDDAADNTKFSIDVNRLGLNAASATVTDIDFSTSNMLLFIQVSDKNNRSVIYQLNIMGQSSKVSTKSSAVGRILALKQDASLLYEDTSTGYVWQVYYNNKQGRWITSQVVADGEKKLRLVGVDSSDNVYLAPTDGKTTGKILYGSLKDKSWQTVSFRQAELLSDLTVTLDGKIYLNDPGNHVLKDVHASTQTAYKGELVGIYDDGFMTRTDGSSATVSSGSSGKSRSTASSASSGSAGAAVWCNSFASDPISTATSSSREGSSSARSSSATGGSSQSSGSSSRK